MRTGAILIASERGENVRTIIEQNVSRQLNRVDVWHEAGRLFTQLADRTYDLLIIDVASLAQTSPVDSFFVRLKSISPPTGVLVLAGPDDRDQAVTCLKQGAAGYILTPLNPIELALKIERVLETQLLRQRLPHTSQFDPADNELMMLLVAGKEISQSLQLDEVLKIILSKAEYVTGADLSRIYLADRNETIHHHESVSKTAPLPSMPRENSLLFTLAQEAAYTRDIVRSQKASTPEWQQQTLQQALLIPMLSRNKLMGVLALGSRQPAAFPDNQVRWLSVFCDRAAIAIENAYLFQDLSSAYIDLAQSREKILHSRNTLQVLFDGITDDLYLFNQNLRSKALKRGGEVQQAFEGGDFIELDAPAQDWSKAAPELLARVKACFETGRETTWIPPEHETNAYLKDREFRIYPVRNRLAQIEQVIVFGQDVSERRRLQASLFRSANLAAVGQLAGSIAHQINNPLTVAMANSQLIMLELDPQSEAHELTTGIFKAADRIQNIVKNLLEFSNQENYFFVETDLVESIEGALALVIRPLRKVKATVSKDYQAQPRLSASVSHLKLVWMNLLLNARDAVAGYADQPEIIIATSMVSEREAKVSITDNGCGITPKNFEQLFRPFFTTKPVGKALGLGLYSAHAIVERHNGQIKALSQPGVSTTFEVILPLDNPRDL